jgi:threonine dehydratase
MTATTAIARDEITRAYDLISPHIRRTPIVDIRGSDVGVDAARLVLKLELLQHTGSFKPRGAFTNLLTHAVPAAGVVAASGGNHGAAVAFAANRLGKAATIFVPTRTPKAKCDRIVSYGARLQLSGDRYDDALAASRTWAAEAGAMEVHAYDQAETLLGQGTVGLEFEQQAPDLDTVIVAIGGGGLIGGMAAWYAGRVKVIGVEPSSAPTLERALRAGHPVDVDVAGVAADSLGARRVGNLMFPIAQAYVNTVALVSDEAIVEAQRRLWDVVRVRAEPGGATAFAALLSGAYAPAHDERVGVVVCGGNAEWAA